MLGFFFKLSAYVRSLIHTNIPCGGLASKASVLPCNNPVPCTKSEYKNKNTIY